MRTPDNRTKRTATIICTVLVLGLILLAPTTALPTINAQVDSSNNASLRQNSQIVMPIGAIKTQLGWVTPLRTHDDKGNLLNTHYDVATQVFGKAPPCSGPNTGLWQEGGNWGNTTPNSQSMGFQTSWTMPTGSITSSSNGIYYNPVNFYYSGSTGTSDPTPYTFFQVDWGIGGGGVQDNWLYTMAYIDSSNHWQYNLFTMPSVPNNAGSTYTVQSAIEPTNLSNPPSYVVQITLGQQSWLSSQPLPYTPQLGDIYNMQSFQDEYIQASGSTTLSSDTVASPQVVLDNNGNIGHDPGAIGSLSAYGPADNTNPPSNMYATYNILVPTITPSFTVTNAPGCPNW